ncbi:MAG: hypothetical protein JW838_08295 [Spirochaetes bacterium]|nr:hypothetical protein [Spirochaetota bacterium]
MIGFLRVAQISMLLIVAAVSTVLSLWAADADAFRECESRCRPLSGTALHRCIRTCMNARRGPGGPDEAGARGNFKECESACSSLGGLEGVRCIRTCMEERRSPRPVPEKKKSEKPAAVSACESRCAVLPDEARMKCMARCKKERRAEYRDPLGLKK